MCVFFWPPIKERKKLPVSWGQDLRERVFFFFSISLVTEIEKLYKQMLGNSSGTSGHLPQALQVRLSLP